MDMQEIRGSEQGQDPNRRVFTHEPLADVLNMHTNFVNLHFVGDPANGEWVLIDAGVSNFADEIEAVAKERFHNNPPSAIVLTHGHFDHVGALDELLTRWDVPVYAHELELPYLTGQADYPPGDPTVGGGMMAILSPMYPCNGIDLGDRVQALPSDGSVPFMKGWRWIHTPGHTRGHISLFRDEDRVLIAGDAFITVKQESAFAVLTQEKEIHGPPAYFTFNWQAAWDSVKRLAELKPSIAITGHGHPMSGQELTDGLERLARDFDTMAIPANRRDLLQ